MSAETPAVGDAVQAAHELLALADVMAAASTSTLSLHDETQETFAEMMVERAVTLKRYICTAPDDDEEQAASGDSEAA